jgi:hypothetical protein
MQARHNEARAAYSQMQGDLEKQYGAAVGVPVTLAEAQGVLAERMALPDWIDAGHRRWACIVRSKGDPQWIEIPGSGPRAAWTADEKHATQTMRKLLEKKPREDGIWESPEDSAW